MAIHLFQADPSGTGHQGLRTASMMQTPMNAIAPSLIAPTSDIEALALAICIALLATLSLTEGKLLR